MADNVDQQRELIAAAMRVYIPAMRRYITRRLDDALGPDWYETWLKERLDGDSLPDYVRERYAENLEAVQRGDRDHRDALGPSEFPFVVSDRRGHFPSEYSPLIDAMHQVLGDRNFQSDVDDSAAQQQTQRLLENCHAILGPIDDGAARRLQTLLDTGDPDSVRVEASPSRSARRPSRRRATPQPAGEQRHDDRSGALGRDAGDARASRPAAPTGRTSSSLAARRDALRDIIDIYRDELRYYISGEFQKAKKPDWPVHVARQARADGRADIAERILREYEEDGVAPDKTIDVGNFAPIVRNNPEVFRDLLRRLGGTDRLYAIADARNRFDGHDKEVPYALHIEQVADDCAFVLGACGKTEAADEVRRVGSWGSESSQVSGAALAVEPPLPEAVPEVNLLPPEAAPTEKDREFDLLRDSDHTEWLASMEWYLTHRPDEWQRIMDRLRQRDVNAWAYELLEQLESDQQTRSEEFVRIIALGRRDRRNAMAAIRNVDEAAWRQAMRRWDRLSDPRPWREEMTALLERDRGAWQSVMDTRRRHQVRDWRSEMDALWRWNANACREEWAALRRRNENAYREEMDALLQRLPEAHAELEVGELTELEGDILAQRAWFDATPDREQRHPDQFARLRGAEKAKQLEEEQQELDGLGDDWDEVGRWFAAVEGRSERYREKHSKLQAWVSRLEREQKALAELGDDWAKMRKWFNRLSGRRQRHPAALAKLELATQESAELRRRGGDLSAQRAWFDEDPERRQRHSGYYESLEAAELLASERRELESLGDDWTEMRRWFATAAGRPERHLQTYGDLEAAEEAERVLE